MKNMEKLKTHISKYIQLDPIQLDEVAGFFHPISFKRKEVVLYTGSICNYDYYIVSGAVKQSRLNVNTGAEEVLSLAISDWWITDLDSLRNHIPSNSTIQAVQNTEALALGRVGFEKLCNRFPQMEQYFRLMTERHLISWMNRIYMRNSLSAEERLDHFINAYPAHYEAFPRYMIASYLGMSAEMLSKIRSRGH